MTAYRYTAYTQSGKRRTGTLVAESQAQATEQLRAKDLFVSEIQTRTAETPGGASRLFQLRGALSSDERAVFTRQLAVLLSADMPVDLALEAAGGSSSPKRIQAVAIATRAALLEGQSLSDALATSQGGFPPYYLAAIAAGESSGELPRVVDELANHIETETGDRARIATALIYPGFVAAVSLMVCAVLVTSVAPQIVGMFESTGRPLPAITVALLGVTDWLGAHWIACLSAIAAVLIAARLALTRPSVRDARDRFLLRLPIVGRLMRLSAAAQYLRTLSLVLSSRQTATDAVQNAARVLRQRQFAGQASEVHSALLRGQSLSAALRNLTIIPTVCVQLIDAGEKSARLAPMTNRASRIVDGWLENDRKRIAALLDPLLMMLVGAFVLVVVLAILLPIFDMQALVTNV